MRGQESEAFRKVRLCIVQREETLDSIAEKYQLSARELVLYNRLPGQTVEEGQVLYIP
ncbi:Stage VI sporulation protein D [compost metagenome]